jgi:hypothetical protein
LRLREKSRLLFTLQWQFNRTQWKRWQKRTKWKKIQGNKRMRD